MQLNTDPFATPAGDMISVEMHQQPGDRSCANEAIDGAHYGPTLIYMCVSSLSYPPTLLWQHTDILRVLEGKGLRRSYGSRQLGKLVQDCRNGLYRWPMGHTDHEHQLWESDRHYPPGITPGDYLIRAEAIALHAASSVCGAQVRLLSPHPALSMLTWVEHNKVLHKLLPGDSDRWWKCLACNREIPRCLLCHVSSS
jgi:hypothetical protein